MRFQTPLVAATLIRRYKRFLADVQLPDGTEVTAHCPNPGAMTGLAQQGARVWVEPNDDPRKKLKYGLRLVEIPGATVLVDTSLPNKIVADALRAGKMAGLPEYSSLRAEVPYGEKSRVDFRLEGARPCWLEVKSVTLSRQPQLAEFPDSVTARGARHLRDLAAMAQQGHDAVLLFLISRDDCTRVDVARDIDPAYAAQYDAARGAGVRILAYDCALTPHEIALRRAIQVA